MWNDTAGIEKGLSKRSQRFLCVHLSSKLVSNYLVNSFSNYLDNLSLNQLKCERKQKKSEVVVITRTPPKLFQECYFQRRRKTVCKVPVAILSEQQQQ